MTKLYFQNLATWRPSDRIDGVLLPANAAIVWTGPELAAFGLYRASPPAEIPEGKQPGNAVEWDGEGVRYVIEDIPPPPAAEVSAAQAKLALEAAGLLDEIETVIASHPVRAVRIWYADANTWVRTHPYIAALGLEVDLDDQAIDALFEAAKLY